MTRSLFSVTTVVECRDLGLVGVRGVKEKSRIHLIISKKLVHGYHRSEIGCDGEVKGRAIKEEETG